MPTIITSDNSSLYPDFTLVPESLLRTHMSDTQQGVENTFTFVVDKKGGTSSLRATFIACLRAAYVAGRRDLYVQKVNKGVLGLVWASHQEDHILTVGCEYSDVKARHQVHLQEESGLVDGPVQGDPIPLFVLNKGSQNSGGYLRAILDLEPFGFKFSIECEPMNTHSTLGARSKRMKAAHGDPDAYEGLP